MHRDAQRPLEWSAAAGLRPADRRAYTRLATSRRSTAIGLVSSRVYALPPREARHGGQSAANVLQVANFSVRLRDLCVSVFLFVFLLLVSTVASAQGRVTGVVKDGDGHPIKGATIRAENPNFTTVTVTSDAKGRYAFLGLRGGAWTLVVKIGRAHV